MGQVDGGVRRARAAVREAIGGLGPGALVLVACSGGADSLALAAALAYEAPRAGRTVRSPAHGVRAGAVIVDHGLQPGSAAVAARAAEQCRGLGLDPVLVREVTVHDAGGGLEAAARDARYAALDRAAREAGADLVLLGHTLDDQAEQVLLGLARGAGARSLAGMPPARGIYRRPFLGLRRGDTEAVCAASGLTFWTDPTNLVPSAGPGPGGGPDSAGPGPGGPDPAGPGEGPPVPLRSRVRGVALPVLEQVLGPGLAEALARSASSLRDDADALDALASDLLERATVERVTGDPGPASSGSTAPGRGRPEDPAAPGVVVHVALDAAVLEAAPRAVRRRALRGAAHLVTAAATTARHIDALEAFVVSWSGQGPAHLPGGARAERAYGRLFLRRVPGAAPNPGVRSGPVRRR
ncbi:tRNA lysidine(34) synthetase TilS [Myceligenerans crystallogenes]|uniref:tRNA(Ile)-lysidine synthase n=1 Tax=Myceligenerans crystallogenes TaxID=316335 RepID=A0ABN2NAN4_9MICO